MFDESPAAAWTEELRVGDVALCDLSLLDLPEEEPRRRPWLLLDLAARMGRRCLVLAPLQHDRLHADRGYEIVVALPRDLRAAGLRRRAVFACRRPRVVPVHGLRGARIGQLEGDRLERLNAVRARLDAERDIRRERLRLLRAERADAARATAAA